MPVAKKYNKNHGSIHESHCQRLKVGRNCKQCMNGFNRYRIKVQSNKCSFTNRGMVFIISLEPYKLSIRYLLFYHVTSRIKIYHSKTRKQILYIHMVTEKSMCIIVIHLFHGLNLFLSTWETRFLQSQRNDTDGVNVQISSHCPHSSWTILPLVYHLVSLLFALLHLCLFLLPLFHLL